MSVLISHLSPVYVCRYWSDYVLQQPANLQNKQRLKPPTKEDVARWISTALDEMQEKSDMVVWSFEACGIHRLGSDVHPDHILEAQLYPDSDDELDDPFNEAEILMSGSDL